MNLKPSKIWACRWIFDRVDINFREKSQFKLKNDFKSLNYNFTLPNFDLYHRITVKYEFKTIKDFNSYWKLKIFTLQSHSLLNLKHHQKWWVELPQLSHQNARSRCHYHKPMLCHECLRHCPPTEWLTPPRIPPRVDRASDKYVTRLKKQFLSRFAHVVIDKPSARSRFKRPKRPEKLISEWRSQLPLSD